MTFPRHSLTLRNVPKSGTGGLFVSPGYGRHTDRVIDSWEIIFVRTGLLHIEEDGVEFRVNPGETLLLAPHRRHRGLSEYVGEVSFYWLHFTPTKKRFADPMDFAQHSRPARPQRLTELFHQYVADQTEGVLTPLAADALLMLLLNELNLPAARSNETAALAIVRKAEQLISHRLQRGVTPGEIARAVGYNTAYLSRLFRRVHGNTLGEFIHRIQVAQARTLLHDSASPLKQIASQCGFGDVGYFRRIFRRELGISPRDYRNRFGRVRINRN
ncbi:MAG: AraC family transcriptional regulator [Tepidisphaeraceae bacterium]